MASKLPWSGSLKTRVTLFTLVIFVISIWSLAYYASRMLREDMQRQLGAQQFSVVTFIAQAVDEQLSLRVKALELVAAQITTATLDNGGAIQSLLLSQPILPTLFSGGVFVTRLEGTAVAEVPAGVGRIGLNFMDRDAVAAALRNGQSFIGQPVMGRRPVVPVFGVGVPIRDGQQRVVGALVGVVAVRDAEFLDHLTQSRYGTTGGYFLVTREGRLIIASTRKERVLQTLAEPGVVPAIDRFVEGFEGSQVYVNQFGLEVLSSVKRLNVVNWGVAASMPTEEAFAPIRDMQQRMLKATVLLTLLAGALTWWMLRRQLAPMLDTAKTLAQRALSDQPPQPLPIARPNEIGDLIAGFNHLLLSLAQREAALKTSEQKLFTILESVDAFIYLKDLQGRYLFANRPVRELFGASMDEIVGYGDEKFFGADSVAQLRQNDQQVLVEGRTLRTEETNFNLRDGQTSTYLSVKLPLRNEAGAIHALCGISTDITERKRMEDQIRQLAFYDVLTELPNRRLLNDRLSQALIACKRSGAHGALMFLDLDNFKPLNDTQGHEVGDLLLAEAGRRLKTCVRAMDTVAGFGGDEFVVMLGELEPDLAESHRQAQQVAQKILASLSAPYRLTVRREGQPEWSIEHCCTASIGVVLFAGPDVNRDDILKWADAAMYQAKEAGGQQIRFFQPDEPRP